MDSDAEREIILRIETLDSMLWAYGPNDIDETDVVKKIFLSKIKEIEDILTDISGKVNRYPY